MAKRGRGGRQSGDGDGDGDWSVDGSCRWIMARSVGRRAKGSEGISRWKNGEMRDDEPGDGTRINIFTY